MEMPRILLWAALFFFCTWSALLARFKGYSATCWLLGGGVVGVLVLICLPCASPFERRTQQRGNRLGVAFSAASLLIALFVRKFL